MGVRSGHGPGQQSRLPQAIQSGYSARQALPTKPILPQSDPVRQSKPLPERLIRAAPDAVVDNARGAWGSDRRLFPPEVRAAYVDALGAPGHVHAIWEEYRPAATLNRVHDAADFAAGRRVRCPLLALWSDQVGKEDRL